MKHLLAVAAILFVFGAIGRTQTVSCTSCPVAGIDPHGSQALGPVTASGTKGCKVTKHNGFPTPDPACTPGAINPTVTLDVLKNPAFRTGCVRDCSTSLSAKGKTYDSYGIAHPANNVGANQTCELDHLVSLELGGADTLDNIWPQCGPKNAALAKRYFKQKDQVENFLAAKVRDEVTDPKQLLIFQKEIASDWTQFLPEAKKWCGQKGHKC